MTDIVENLILERVRPIDDRPSNIEGDVRDLKLCTTAVEEPLLRIQTSLFGLNQQMDRFDERLERVERRIDLKDVS